VYQIWNIRVQSFQRYIQHIKNYVDFGDNRVHKSQFIKTDSYIMSIKILIKFVKKVDNN